MLGVRKSRTVVGGLDNTSLDGFDDSNGLRIALGNQYVDWATAVMIDRHRGTESLAVLTATTFNAQELTQVSGRAGCALVCEQHLLEDIDRGLNLLLGGHVCLGILLEHIERFVGDFLWGLDRAAGFRVASAC